MSASVSRVVIVGRDAALWLAAGTLRAALGPAGVVVEAVELPSLLAPADVYPTLPALEALHHRLRVDEAILLRNTRGAFTLGQNFADPTGAVPAFLHAYGSAGAPIEGGDFFAYWLKARRHGLAVGLEDFSLTAAAARQGRLFIPDDESDLYGRADYGYHLPARAYADSLKAIALDHGAIARAADGVAVERDARGIAAVSFGETRIEGDLFVDASGAEALLIGQSLGVARESWRALFPGDRVLVGQGPRLASIPVYAEIRAWEQGWAGLFPSQFATHLLASYASDLISDDEAAHGAAAAAGIALDGVAVRVSDPGRRVAWAQNCIAVGASACAFDPVHGVELHGVQLGLVHLLACFPAGADFAAERRDYNRRVGDAFAWVRDFQAAHYRLARYPGAYWDRARVGETPSDLAHRIALFAARGEIAPYEEDSLSPDSWRALLIGHGVEPADWLPGIDRTPPETMRAQLRRMLGFVREAVLRQPTHDAYLARIGGNG